MAIEKMKLLSITGKDTDLEKFLAKNLLNLDIQIEDAKKVYKKGWRLEYFNYDYTVKEYIKKAEKLINEFDIKVDGDYWNQDINKSLSEIKSEIEDISIELNNVKSIIKQLNDENIEIKNQYDIIKNLATVDTKIENLYNLKYMRFRYGTVPTKNLDEINKKIENIDAVFFELKQDEDLTWVLYITTEEFISKVDSYFNVQDFERVWIPKEAVGTPMEYIQNLDQKIKEKSIEIEDANRSIECIKSENKKRIVSLYNQLQMYENVNKLKKFIAKDQNGTFYIVIWVSNTSIENIKNIIEHYENLDCEVFDDDEDVHPPTKLKNFSLFRPFESIVKMYGVPNSKEVDPTVLVAITAFIMFGFMFGDVGHGIVIMLFGIFMSRKRSSLGPVFVAGGISSVIFGILYGSVFGKENIIKPILISPMENIQTMLISGIAVGSIFILIAMIFNIVNGLKNKDLHRWLFDKNGITGFILYGLILIEVAMYFLKGKFFISMNLLIIIAIFLLIMILFGDVLSSKIKRKKQNAKTPIVEKIFEIVEMALSMASNTISFLRLAAFAINHVGLCMAVYLLADMTTGVGNIAISIIGNIIVIVLEGLIVGIQVLRLEYYELFSRFYEGNGREYKSIKNQIKE